MGINQCTVLGWWVLEDSLDGDRGCVGHAGVDSLQGDPEKVVPKESLDLLVV